MARVWAESTQSGSHLLMLLAIADFADDDGNAYPAVTTLATKCRMRPRNAQVLLAALRRCGELDVRENEGPRGTNLYRITVGQGVQSLAGVQKLAGVQGNARGGAKPCAKPLQRLAYEPSGNRHEPPKAARKHAAKFDATTIELPDWLPRETWADWVADRRERRKPLSSRAAEKQLKQLAQLKAEGHDPVSVIDSSIANGWQGLFAPKGASRTERHAGRPVLAADDVFTGAMA